MPGPSQDPLSVIDLDSRAVSVALGRRLRELRTERGISQERLALRTGLHATTIGRMERGDREPRATMSLRLAQGLEVPPGALLDALETSPV
jgi:transcriptional regulator with XRE-family HTH domain